MVQFQPSVHLEHKGHQEVEDLRAETEMFGAYTYLANG